MKWHIAALRELAKIIVPLLAAALLERLDAPRDQPELPLEPADGNRR